MSESVSELRYRISEAEKELQILKQKLHQAEQDASAAFADGQTIDRPLALDEYKRYGRQLIMPEVGLEGQLQLKRAKVLLVGMGGLGSPAAAYLAGAGVDTLGLMDGDTVELSNLHRQIVHNVSRVGMTKIRSAYEYLHALNPLPTYNLHESHLTPTTAVDIFSTYDLVLDCTDHPTSRYLISDACILAGKPLVSASALRTEGQLIVLNSPPRPPGDNLGGPCYRCIWPRPPPADSVLSCGEGGILGPVVGVMGVLQALEAIKIITTKQSTTNVDQAIEAPKPSMLLFSAYAAPQFRTIRLRSRHASCTACSAKATVTPQTLKSGAMDYVAFCGTTTPVKMLPAESRVSATELSILTARHSILDVRDETQFAICHLPDAINIPWKGNAERWVQAARADSRLNLSSSHNTTAELPLYVICRLGNDSQFAVQALQDANLDTDITIKDIAGGFRAWRDEVDPTWPDY